VGRRRELDIDRVTGPDLAAMRPGWMPSSWRHGLRNGVLGGPANIPGRDDAPGGYGNA
jgi:hypothetical protein